MPKKANKKKQSKSSNNTQEKLLIAIISIILGLGLGFGIGALNESEVDNKSTAESSEMTNGHSSTYEVALENAPTVDFIVEEDAKSGWNIKILTSNFTFTPANVNKENVMGEGHAHLYVDGEKVARVYSEYFHYPGNFDGTKMFEIELNANDHSPYTVEGMTINARKEVVHDDSETPHGSDMNMKKEDDSHSE